MSNFSLKANGAATSAAFVNDRTAAGRGEGLALSRNGAVIDFLNSDSRAAVCPFVALFISF